MEGLIVKNEAPKTPASQSIRYLLSAEGELIVELDQLLQSEENKINSSLYATPPHTHTYFDEEGSQPQNKVTQTPGGGSQPFSTNC